MSGNPASLYKQVVAECGLGVNERATIYGVTRQTIRRWDLGLFPKAEAMLGLVVSVSTKLLTARGKGVLPIKLPATDRKTTARTRRAMVEKIKTIVRG